MTHVNGYVLIMEMWEMGKHSLSVAYTFDAKYCYVLVMYILYADNDLPKNPVLSLFRVLA